MSCTDLVCRVAALAIAILTLWSKECSSNPTAAVEMMGSKMPCLPDRQEFWGTDTKHPYRSYFALDFVEGKSGIKRHGIGKMVKVWSSPQALRFDIDPVSCKVTKISSERDVPQCVPTSAVKEGNIWSFKNIDGATLSYQDSNPSRVVKKVSPDGKNSDTFSDWNNTVSDSLVFLIPTRCDDVTNDSY